MPGFTSVPLTPTIAPPPGFAVFFFPAGDKPNMAHMFNVGVQRQLPWSSVLDVSYVGTRGKNIFVSRNVNVPLPGPGNLDQRRPYFALAPNIPVINQRSGDAESWYDALQVKVDKRFSRGLQGLLAYTYSRTEDTAFILHPAIETRAPATGKAIDIPHNFVLELVVRASIRIRQAVPVRRVRRGAEAGRGLGGERHHDVSKRPATEHQVDLVAAQHRHRQLRQRHLQ